jgi:hypothetical protein
MVFELSGDPGIQFGDLSVIELDEPPQRPHPGLIGVGHRGFIQPLGPTRSPQVINWREQTFLA